MYVILSNENVFVFFWKKKKKKNILQIIFEFESNMQILAEYNLAGNFSHGII
jgi:hypothetical protein